MAGRAFSQSLWAFQRSKAQEPVSQHQPALENQMPTNLKVDGQVQPEEHQ